MGQPKLLLPWGERTIIEHTLAAWRASRVSQVVVTLNADDAALHSAVERTGAEICPVDPPPPDMKASVAGGLRFVADRFQPQSGDVWLLAPADLPTLSAAVIDRLLAAHRPEQPTILVASHDGRRGHPALFPWELAAEVERLGDDEGINRLLQRHPTQLVECGPEALPLDVDTPEDYHRLRAETKERAAADRA
jgi:molybdenum cofactor cytidylyltransferase